MIRVFFSFLISSFILLIISCGQTTEEGVSSAVSSANNAVNDTTGTIDDSLFGENEGSILGDELPKNIVFGKTILDPNTLKSNEFEESGSDVIKTSYGDYVVVGTSVSWEWPMPDNMEDILLVKLDGASGDIIWNKKIHMRNFDRGPRLLKTMMAIM